MGGYTGALTSGQHASGKRGGPQLYGSGKVPQDVPALLANRCATLFVLGPVDAKLGEITENEEGENFNAKVRKRIAGERISTV